MRRLWRWCNSCYDDPKVRDRLQRLSFIAMAAVLFYFVAYSIHAGQQRDEAIAKLQQTNDGIIAKLTEVFVAASEAEAAAREANTVPETTVAAIVESLRGYVDPSLIDRAVDAARASVAAKQGPPGPAGPRGPPGSSGTSTSSPTTTTATRSTTSTSPPPTTTTTQPPPTTTTTAPKRCLIDLPPLARVGC